MIYATVLLFAVFEIPNDVHIFFLQTSSIYEKQAEYKFTRHVTSQLRTHFLTLSVEFFGQLLSSVWRSETKAADNKFQDDRHLWHDGW